MITKGDRVSWCIYRGWGFIPGSILTLPREGRLNEEVLSTIGSHRPDVSSHDAIRVFQSIHAVG